jgi:TatD DNase family protein
MTHSLVDFHCHLDLYPDFENVVKESERLGIYTLAVTTTPRAWQSNYELTRTLRYVRPALGFHPQLVGKNTAQELKLWEQYLPQAKYIGEVGLDAGPDFFRTLDEQKKVFERILTLCAVAGGKVLSVHALRSVNAVLDMVETLLPRNRGVVVLHWFTGTPAQAQRAIKLGCYFSINAPMLYSERSEPLLRLIPSDRLLTETDGPFTRSDNKPSRPKDIADTMRLLSKMRNVSQEQMGEQITANLKNLLTDD